MNETLINNSSTFPIPAGYIVQKVDGMYIFDGRNWHHLGSVDDKINQLCQKHPGLAELKKERDAAQEKFDAFLALVKE